VRAVPRADAAVVRHLVQPLGAVRRRLDGAHELARRVLALHARHRLAVHARIFLRALEVAVEADPVHHAAAVDLLLADDRDVVLRDARRDARTARGARGEVDDHAPGVVADLTASFGDLGADLRVVDRGRAFRFELALLLRDAVRVALEVLERAHAKDLALLDFALDDFVIDVVLCRRDLRRVTGLGELRV